MFKKIILLILALLLSGCIGMSPARPKVLKPESLHEGGFIYGSISRPRSGRGYERYQLYVRSLESREEFRFGFSADVPGYTMFTPTDEPDFFDEESEKWIFVQKFKPGEYEFFSFSTFNNYTTMTTTWRPENDFSCRFSINEGAILYFGELYFEHTQTKNLLGFTIAGRPIVSVHDYFESDSRLTKALYPEVDWVSAVRAGPLSENEKTQCFSISGKDGI